MSLQSCGWLVLVGRHLPGRRGARGFSWEEVPAAAQCHRGLIQSPPGRLLLQSMPQKPCPHSWGLLQLGIMAIPSPGPQRAAQSHPAPSAWGERQRFANQSQFSCDANIWVFQSWFFTRPSHGALSSAGAHRTTVPPSLSLPLSLRSL